jgi:hypothetical protein
MKRPNAVGDLQKGERYVIGLPHINMQANRSAGIATWIIYSTEVFGPPPLSR